MKSLEKKEITLLALQTAGLILMFLMSNIFWLLFIINISILAYSMFWIFGLKINKDNFKKDLFYILMPVLYFVGVIFFMTAIKSVLLQIIILGLYALSNHYYIKHIADIKLGDEDCSVSSRNIVSMISFIMIFLVTTALVNAFIFYKLPLFLFLSLAFAATWAITYFLFLQYNLASERTLPYIYLAAFGIMELLFASSFWIINYPLSKIGELGIPLISIICLVIFYTFWGISHHKLTNTLTKKVLVEYIMISITIISILLFTTKWIPQGVVG